MMPMNPKVGRVAVSVRGGVLLSGPYGLYQRQDALYLAGKALSTDAPEEHPDFISVEAVDGVLGVESVECLMKRLSMLTARAERYVVLIDHMEQMNLSAQNKLLKVLEEWDAFFLCIYYGEDVLATIKSRLLVIPYAPYSYEDYKNITGGDLESYCITGGCPLLAGDAEVAELFRAVKACFLKKDIAGVYSLLHLVQEKDKDCFYVRYRDKVGALFSYIGRVYADMGIPFEVIKETVRCGMASSDNRRYTQADFFGDIAGVLEGGIKNVV